ncbi:MAG TPA: tetratricopeptide repeat protein [Candidatus Angelobacter sp.]|nr:tetratricopeptide repeat protein [Candidatus Angelobacter sp.]
MNRSGRLVAALAVAAALLSVTGCSKLRARDQLNQGVKAYKDAKYEQAIGHFQRAVSLDQDLDVAKLYLATAYAIQYVPGVDSPDNNRNAQQAIDGYKEVLGKDQGNITSLKGIAYLFMNMRRFEESREYYKKVIETDPNDPEAYYSVAVIDWTAAYKDTAERKAKAGLKVDDELKGKQDQKLCEEIKAANQARVDEGLKMLQTAMEKRQDYDDAMAYVNLLYRRKADMECGDQQARMADIKAADSFSDKAMAARKKKADEAAKKVSGGIILDATPTPSPTPGK